MNNEHVIDELFDLMTRRGGYEAYCGEPVTQTQHMLQAALLAEREDADPTLIGAALLHDIGHLLNGDNKDAGDHPHDRAHEHVAAARLGPDFVDALVQPVALHVDAKRYLCFVEPGYFERLSPKSVHTLQLQGGPMNAAQADEFERGPHAEAAVRLRRWDERAKDPAATTPPLAHFRPCLRAGLR